MDKVVLRGAAEEGAAPFWSSIIMPILKYRRVSYTIVGVTVLVTLVYCLLIPNQYTSTATILPTSGSDQLSELKEMAAGSLGEMGLGSMLQAKENSSALYPKVISSRLITEKILNRDFRFNHDGQAYAMTLMDYLESENIDLAQRKLASMTGVGVDRKTGVISLSFTSRYPELSAGVVHAYLEELDDYNKNYRQSKAKDNEKFIAERLEDVKNELIKAENNLSAFQDQNLNYSVSGDPELRRELNKLQREMTIKETVYLTLTKQYELAKVEAVKDLPVVQVLDRGSIPLIKSAPRRSMYMMGAFFGSVFFSVILSLWLSLAVKRRVRKNIDLVLSSEEIKINRFESKIISQANRLAKLMDHKQEEKVS